MRNGPGALMRADISSDDLGRGGFEDDLWGLVGAELHLLTRIPAVEISARIVRTGPPGWRRTAHPEIANRIDAHVLVGRVDLGVDAKVRELIGRVLADDRAVGGRGA